MQNNAYPVYQTRKEKDNRSRIAIVVLFALILLIIVFAIIMFFVKKTTEDPIAKQQQAFEAALKESVAKEIVLFYYDDFDGDGDYEAFAVMGDGNTKNGTYTDAELWYKTEDSYEKVAESISGRANGIVADGSKKFLSLENDIKRKNYTSANTGTKNSRPDSASDLYGVKDNKPYRPDISGKYKNIHQQDEKIIAESKDFKGSFVLTVDGSGELSAEKYDKSGDRSTGNQSAGFPALEPADSDWDQLEGIVASLCGAPISRQGFNTAEGEIYNYKSISAETAFNGIIMESLSPLYDAVFPGSASVSDPLNKAATGEWNICFCFNKNKADFILQDILNLTAVSAPSEGKLISNGGYEKLDYYYYQGNYYCGKGDVRRNIPDEYYVNNYSVDSDGVFTINCSVNDPGSDAFIAEVTISAVLKESNGMRYWSIYSVKYKEVQKRG